MENRGSKARVESTTRGKRTPSSGYLPTLDGWRALAILSVIAGHDRVYHLGPLSTVWLNSNGGERGVELFFALSGILICSRLLEEECIRGRIDLKGFYIRRLCRIQPAAFLYLAALCLLMLARVLVWRGNDLLASVLLVRNYLPLHEADHSWYTDHFWSLSIEEHFYLFLPGFLLLVRRFRFQILSALAVALELGRNLVLYRDSFRPAVQFHSDLSAGPIVLAAAVAVLLRRPGFRAWCVRRLTPSVVFATTAALWTAIEIHHGRFTHAVLTCTFPALIVSTMLHPRAFVGRVLESAPLRFIGRISYSLYLWQMLVFTFTYKLMPPHSRLLVYLQTTSWRYAAVLFAATISFYCVERPLMRLGHRLARPATPGREDLEPTADGLASPLAATT